MIEDDREISISKYKKVDVRDKKRNSEMRLIKKKNLKKILGKRLKDIAK